jgi:beta-glucosidase
MTLEEKVGQMTQVPASLCDGKEAIDTLHVGSFLHCNLTQLVELQAYAREKTRLGIPLIMGIDAIHGNCFYDGATVFPTQLAMAQAWDPELTREFGAVTAAETRAVNIHWTFSPVLCMARDLRWGRVDETFGEDPWLSGELAAAAVRGYQGLAPDSASINDSFGPDSILACAKHFAAYGEVTGGRDATEVEVSRRKMHEVFLPPFRKVFAAGCASAMAAYHAIDGVPCSANEWLLRQLPKEDWKWEGFMVTDWNNVGNLSGLQFVAEDADEAARQAILAGNDMIMTTPDFYESAIRLVRSGAIAEKLIDEACARVLIAKFKLGLFEDPQIRDEAARKASFGSAAHKRVALNIGRESITLLKNEGDLLPLKPGLKKILVTGPAAHDIAAQLGDWSFGTAQAAWTNPDIHRKTSVSLLAGIIHQSNEKGCAVEYAPGCDLESSSHELIPEALAAAREADVIVAVVGDCMPYYGEFHDNAALKLPGAQNELVVALAKTGKPLILVFAASKPYCIPELAEASQAVLCLFNSGNLGGLALAETLWGDVNSSGKLPVSFPRSSGQMPIHYQSYPGWHSVFCGILNKNKEKYVDQEVGPLYAFGQGLSYTRFAYSGFSLKSDNLNGQDLEVEFTLKNEGDREGAEVAQLYIHDDVASVTLPTKRLKAFARVNLKAGESRRVSFRVPFAELSVVTPDLRRVVERGTFKALIGSSSRDADLVPLAFSVENTQVIEQLR